MLSNSQCGFRKGCRAQNCLLMMLKFWKDASDKNKAFGALLTNLSEAFNCLCHGLLITKLPAYALDMSYLNLLQDYLSNHKQRTKVHFCSMFLCVDMFLTLKTVYLTNYANYINDRWYQRCNTVFKRSWWKSYQLVCKQSNETESWQMSPTSKYWRADHFKNRQFTHKTFLVQTIIRYKFCL